MDVMSAARAKYREEGATKTGIAIAEFVGERVRWKTIDPILFRLWDAGYLDFDQIYSETYFQQMTRETAMADAEEFGQYLIERYEPTSVIDLGCGVGRFLYPFWQNDIAVYGVDASETAIKNGAVPGSIWSNTTCEKCTVRRNRPISCFA